MNRGHVGRINDRTVWPWVDISTINLVHNDRLCIVLEDCEPLKTEAELAIV
jgi:hypothetical protein